MGVGDDAAEERGAGSGENERVSRAERSGARAANHLPPERCTLRCGHLFFIPRERIRIRSPLTLSQRRHLPLPLLRLRRFRPPERQNPPLPPRLPRSNPSAPAPAQSAPIPNPSPWRRSPPPSAPRPSPDPAPPPPTPSRYGCSGVRALPLLLALSSWRSPVAVCCGPRRWLRVPFGVYCRA